MAGRGQGLLGVGMVCPLKGQKNNRWYQAAYEKAAEWDTASKPGAVFTQTRSMALDYALACAPSLISRGDVRSHHSEVTFAMFLAKADSCVPG